MLLVPVVRDVLLTELLEGRMMQGGADSIKPASDIAVTGCYNYEQIGFY